jgi:hypothetical protein
MNTQEMIEYTRFLLQEKDPGTWEDEELVAFINQGNKKISWMARVEDVHVAELVDATEYVIPADVKETIQEIAYATVGDSLKKIPYKEFSGNIRFYQPQTGTLRIYFYKNTTDLSLTALDFTSEVDQNFHESACVFGAMRAKQNDEEFLQAKEFERQFNEELMKAMRKYKTVGTRFIQAE